MASTLNCDNGVSSGTSGVKITSDASGVLAIQSSGTTTATFDTSGNLGIGTASPSTYGKLAVNGQGAFLGGGAAQLGFYNSDNTNYYALGNQGATGSTNAALVFYQGGGSGERMRLDASGNLGLGVTPSAWNSDYKNFAIGTGGEFYGRVSTTEVGIGSNFYRNSGGSYIYLTSAAASYQAQVGGVSYWFNAPSGTAGNAITFTQAMTLDSSGNLLVGATSQTSTEKFNVSTTSTRVCQFQSQHNTSGDVNQYWTLGSNANNTSSYFLICNQPSVRDALYIYGNGNVVNVNNSYGTLSDVKLKDNIVDATPKLADVMRLQVRNFNLKSDPSHKQIGFVAQELEQVFPAMIDENPDLDAESNPTGTSTKSIKTSVLVPILVKALQELTAKVNDLETKLAAKG